MRNVHHRVACSHDLSELPVFNWANGRSAYPPTYGQRRIRRQTGLPLHVAMTIAELAGIGAQRTK